MAAQWHPTLNEDLKPAAVTLGSSKKVWWLCPKISCVHKHPHAYKARVCDRASGKNRSGCPFCSGLKVCTSTVQPCTHNVAWSIPRPDWGHTLCLTRREPMSAFTRSKKGGWSRTRSAEVGLMAGWKVVSSCAPEILMHEPGCQSCQLVHGDVDIHMLPD